MISSKRTLLRMILWLRATIVEGEIKIKAHGPGEMVQLCSRHTSKSTQEHMSLARQSLERHLPYVQIRKPDIMAFDIDAFHPEPQAAFGVKADGDNAALMIG